MSPALRPPRYWGGDQVMLTSIEVFLGFSVKLAPFSVGVPGKLLHPTTLQIT